ncbi:ATP-binding protein [Mongoliimonas terrestris]|uniref:ATP-binding protein n=1 Tax=Mongoliimonas terrestris TaxID=1709001 RepID=UPI0009495A55|nr:ATP-binding protein [Mongoliimonas terrestris]
MEMAGADDSRTPTTASSRAVARLRAHRLLLAVAAMVAGAAILVYDVPMAGAAAGLLILAGAVAFGLGGAPHRPPDRPARTSGTTPVWPDTGMKLVVDVIEDPCFITDGTGIVRYQNHAAGERFGMARPGDPLSFKLRVPELLAALERVGRGGDVEAVRFAERVPTERAWLARVAGVRVGRREGRARTDFILVRLHDETEMMRVERMRVDFIANASHELRTPLASLTGFVETLLGPARNDEVNRERFLKIMLEQAGRMARLIDDLLSLSRIEMKAHLRPETSVDMAQVVGQVIDMLGPLAEETGARVVRTLAPVDHRVRGDRDELIQVTTNLVENALKYGRDGGRVDITLTAEKGPDGAEGRLLTVRDDGPGIAPEHLPRLTERFYRVDADQSRRRKGTGLGLAIVKHIVARHRGRLSIRSTPGEGASFSIWLESAPAAAAGAGSAVRPGPAVDLSLDRH